MSAWAAGRRTRAPHGWPAVRRRRPAHRARTRPRRPRRNRPRSEAELAAKLRGDIGRAHGPADRIALREVAAHGAQDVGVLVVLDALGDGAEAELVGEVDERAGEVGVLGLADA